MDNDEEMCTALLLLLQLQKQNKGNIKKKRKPRQYKVRPLNRLRKKNGFYTVYFLRMKRLDPTQFFKYTRMNVTTFDTLLTWITPYIKKRSMNNAVLPEERLAITLHYLSQGSSMQTIGWKYHLGKSTIHCIIEETCLAICRELEPRFLKAPQSEEEWHAIARGFLHKWNFPHCIGALDGKHIKMRAPRKSGSMYFSYLKVFSVVLLAVCDHAYRFLIVDIGGYGSISDGGTLKDSAFGQQLQKNKLKIPKREPIPGNNNTTAFPYWFVADSAFPLSEHIIRPYPGVLLSEEKDNFNKRLSRARRLIENAFGVLAARWRILYQTINADVELVELITKTCVCLHNFLCSASTSLYCPSGYVDVGDDENGQWRSELPTPLTSIRLNVRNARHNLYLLRDQLARYLNEEGDV